MKIKRKKKERLAAGSASSDIAFLLIIYFIVIAGFNINKGFLMDIPAKNSTRLMLKDDIMRFYLDSGGDVIYSGSRLNKRQIERYIRQGIGEHPNMAVLLTVSPAAPWQSVVSFVETAERLQVNSFSFKMDKTEGGEGEQGAQSGQGARNGQSARNGQGE